MASDWQKWLKEHDPRSEWDRKFGKNKDTDPNLAALFLLVFLIAMFFLMVG